MEKSALNPYTKIPQDAVEVYDFCLMQSQNHCSILKSLLEYLCLDNLQRFAYAYDNLSNRGEAQRRGRNYAKKLQSHLQNLGIERPAKTGAEKSTRLTNLRKLFNAYYYINEESSSYYIRLCKVKIFLEWLKAEYPELRNPNCKLAKLLDLCNFLQVFYYEVAVPYINGRTYKQAYCIREDMI